MRSKKLSFGIFIAIVILFGILFFPNKVNAESDLNPNYYLGINEFREGTTPENMAYGINNPDRNGSTEDSIIGAKIWKIVKYNSNNESDNVYDDTISFYCVKAGVGFSDTTKRAAYNKSYDLVKDRTAIYNTNNSTLQSIVTAANDNYYGIIALADLMYVPESSNSQDKINLLNAAYSSVGVNASAYPVPLTDDDIDAVQQAALWYFTNNDGGTVYQNVYNQLGKKLWFTYKTDRMSEYSNLSDYDLINGTGAQREAQAYILYDYLINTAKANIASYKNGSKVTRNKITLYTDPSVEAQQPVITIEKDKPFDLALRKYITKVGTKVLQNTDSRVPVIDTSSIEKTQTAKYKHKKDPVEVNIGDIVTYNITVYNEGSKAGRATKIVDQLPTGLKFKKINTAGFTAQYDETTNKVTFVRNGTNTANLDPYTGGTLASETLEIECEVSRDVSVTNKDVLTNVAWISEEFNAVDNLLITNTKGDDRDSVPGEAPKVNKDNMSDYKGNTSNQTELNDSEYYYKGQEDDDDFEKIIVKTFDMALRKYITKVGTNVLQNADSRVPVIQTSTISTNGTATYKHKKDPVPVKDGDIVTYNITVYNEGDKAGGVTKIVDQLPTGLEFVRLVSAGTSYNASYNKNSNIVTFTRDVNEAKILQAYDGSNSTLESETIEIECKVSKNNNTKEVILTNVAWILEEYNAVDKLVITNTKGQDRDSVPEEAPDVNKDNMSNYKGNTSNKPNLEDSRYYYKGEQDDDDFEKLVLSPKEFDLKLIKRIVEVNSVKVPERIESVDVSKLNTVGTDGKKVTTATYNINKEAVPVKKGDIIKYGIRVYNEGEIDGYAAEISENIPDGLEFIWSEKLEDELNKDTTLTQEEKTAILYNQLIWSPSVRNGDTQKIEMVTTNYLAKGEGLEKSERGANLINAFDSSLGYVDTTRQKNPDYKEVYVYMKVIADDIGGTTIRNEAAVTKDTDPNGEPVDDRDSQPENWPGKDPDHKYQDDEDYDNVILQVFDLSLRKFIAAVSKDSEISDSDYLKNDDGTYTRAPEVDASKLNTIDEDGNKITTAIYKHPKTPVEVDKNNYIVYMLRAYNEGDMDGYAAEIKDHLPENLKFVDGEFNTKYGWKVSEDGRTVTTDYLKNQKIEKVATDRNGVKTLSYVEVPILCQLSDVKVNEVITNIADITQYKDENNNDIIDRDSQKDNVDLPDDSELPNYKDDEIGEYVPGQQDDDDFEKVIVKPFDLALRKFITQVNKNAVDSRIPQVNYDKENDKISYQHAKDPVDVVTGDIVTYTIRVFNEGQKDGYAAEITDDLPAGLEFLPENDINKEYRWVMYDKDGKETTEVSQAVKITTDYLSKEQGEAKMSEDEELEENPYLLKAFNAEEEISDTNPHYLDVKVAFKVVEPNTSDKIIVNAAQISKDADKDGNEVDDDDSVPGEWNDGEDDQDKEYIKLNYFDLALRKWVTQAIVIENGKETVTQTGHTPEQDPEPIVKVDINRKKINKVTVKFRYSIRVTNQGDIAGYAKEVKDYVPQGLKFVAADNPGWTDLGNNVISTNLLADKLLKPGESADVQVLLTWINGQDNMGLKTNTAEISKDYNDKGVPDKDSTPDNKKPGEDDIDDAPVMLSVATGIAKVYYSLGFIVLITIAGGIVLIKKFVL